MATFGAGRRRWRRAAAGVGFVLAAAPALPAERTLVDPAVDVRVYLPGAGDVGAVKAALAGARRRLESGSCQILFTEFAGGDGRPLAASLEGLGQTGASYLSLLSFYNGDGAPRCQDSLLPISAFTVPGSRVIHVCPRFAGIQRRDSREAEATLIHEALHSLGLGENPPSSRHIRARVLALCPDAR